MSEVLIGRPKMGAVEELVELWITLAEGQRTHGSHLEGEVNRDRIKETFSRSIALSECHVARDEGDIVGFVMYTIEGDTFEKSVIRGLVQNLFVVASHRRKGIGSRLLERAEAALADQGADVVGLDVMAKNESARSFYREHGYDPHRINLEKRIENDTS